MTNRRPLRNQITEAWTLCIDDDYCSQRINSEHSLQASFWSHLNTLLPHNRRLFIEPTMHVRIPGGIKRIMPDIVVCNTREVIGIIELKYTPRIGPRHAKDLRNLDMIARNRRGVTIANDRFRGKTTDAKSYSLAKSIIFAWCGVHSSIGENYRLFSEGYRSLNDCYLQLHAETQDATVPLVYEVTG